MSLKPVIAGTGFYKKSGGSASFASLTGVPADNAALVTALGLKFDKTGGTITGPIAISGGTVTDSTPLLNISQTWNDAADTFHLDTANVINTASQAASTLLRRQVGGVTRFSVGVDGKITILAQGYPAPSISSTANPNYGIGFNSGPASLIANNQEVAAGMYGTVNGTNRPWLAATAILLTGYSSAPSGTGINAGVFLSLLNPDELTLGYTHATTFVNQAIKAHDVTNGTAAKLTLAGGNAVTTGIGGDVHVRGGTGSSGEGATLLGTAAGAIGFFGAAPVTQPAHISDPTGAASGGIDTVDLPSLSGAISDINAAIAAINAVLADLGLTAAS